MSKSKFYKGNAGYRIFNLQGVTVKPDGEVPEKVPGIWEAAKKIKPGEAVKFVNFSQAGINYEAFGYLTDEVQADRYDPNDYDYHYTTTTSRRITTGGQYIYIGEEDSVFVSSNGGLD